MVRPVTPPDEPKLTDTSYHIQQKDKVAASSVASSSSGNCASTNNCIKTASRPFDRKIIVTCGNPETVLTKLFENVEEKATPNKRVEVALGTASNLKNPVPPYNSMRRGR